MQMFNTSVSQATCHSPFCIPSCALALHILGLRVKRGRERPMVLSSLTASPAKHMNMPILFFSTVSIRPLPCGRERALWGDSNRDRSAQWRKTNNDMGEQGLQAAGVAGIHNWAPLPLLSTTPKRPFGCPLLLNPHFYGQVWRKDFFFCTKGIFARSSGGYLVCLHKDTCVTTWASTFPGFKGH